jgi:hypothetical protein
MKAKRVFTGIILIAVMAMLLGLSAPAYAQIPPIPHSFYGNLTIDDEPAPVGTMVEALDAGGKVLTQVSGNPIVTHLEGWYGEAGEGNPKLLVQGNLSDGTELAFRVKGSATGNVWVFADQTWEWHSAETTLLNLSVPLEEEEEEEVGGGGGGAGGGDEEEEEEEGAGGGGEGGEGGEGSQTAGANLFGNEFTFSISPTGEILQTITATSSDGQVSITIPAGTIALDRNQNPISSLMVAANPDPVCPLVEGAHIIGLAYDFMPDGTTFDPPITVVFTYNEEDVPEGIAEEDLVLAYCDETSLKWVEVDSKVNTEDNTITANIYHFTCFAILYYEVAEVTPTPVQVPPTKLPAAFTISSLSISPVEVNVGETVTISLTVTNTGGESGVYQVTLKINGVVEDTKEVTIAAGASQEVKLTTSKDAAGTYTVDCNGLVGSFVVKEAGVAPPVTEEAPPAESQLNWPVLGGFIAAVVVVISLVIFFVVRRRSAY